MSVVRELLVKLGFQVDASGAKAFEAQTKQTTAAVQADAKAVTVAGKATEGAGKASATAAVAKGKDAAATKEVTTATVGQAKANKAVGITATEAAAGLDTMTGGLLSGVVAAVSLKAAFTLLAGAIGDTIAKGNKVFADSARLNVYGENLQRVQAIADRTGASMATLDSGLRAVRGSLVQAAMGNSYAAAGFAGLGVKLTDSKGKLKSTTEAMADAATALAKMEPGWRKNWLATQVFGASAAELMPVLNRGGDALRGFMRDSEAFGNNLTENQVKASVKAADGLARLGQRAEGLKTVFGAALTPEVNALITRLNAFGDAHLVESIAMIKDAALGLGEGLHWAGDQAEFLYKQLGTVVDYYKKLNPDQVGDTLSMQKQAKDRARTENAISQATASAGRGAASVGLPTAGASLGVSAASTAAYAGALKALQVTNNNSNTTTFGDTVVNVKVSSGEDADSVGEKIAKAVELSQQNRLNTRANTYRPVANQR